MSTHSDKLIAGIQYTACPGCAGTGRTGIVKRPCNLCRGKGKLPVSRPDGEGWMKK
jgi:DnaJ-class molecular chaperone